MTDLEFAGLLLLCLAGFVLAVLLYTLWPFDSEPPRDFDDTDLIQ